MNIRIKTSGQVTVSLPAADSREGARLELPDGATVLDAMRQVGLDTGASYLVVLNSTSLPRAERATRALAEGDELAILPPLRGG
jgi:sulfur carrier protein ThiS